MFPLTITRSLITLVNKIWNKVTLTIYFFLGRFNYKTCSEKDIKSSSEEKLFKYQDGPLGQDKIGSV
jgi:hypothetical protein